MIRLVSFGKAVQDFLGAGAPAVSVAEYAARIDACHDCPHRLGARCNLSSCQCWIWAKAIDRRQECPAERWDATSRAWDSAHPAG